MPAYEPMNITNITAFHQLNEQTAAKSIFKSKNITK